LHGSGGTAAGAARCQPLVVSCCGGLGGGGFVYSATYLAWCSRRRVDLAALALERHGNTRAPVADRSARVFNGAPAAPPITRLLVGRCYPYRDNWKRNGRALIAGRRPTGSHGGDGRRSVHPAAGV